MASMRHSKSTFIMLLATRILAEVCFLTGARWWGKWADSGLSLQSQSELTESQKAAIQAYEAQPKGLVDRLEPKVTDAA